MWLGTPKTMRKSQSSQSSRPTASESMSQPMTTIVKYVDSAFHVGAKKQQKRYTVRNYMPCMTPSPAPRKLQPVSP